MAYLVLIIIMRFIQETIKHLDTGVEATVFLPIDAHKPIIGVDGLTEVDVEGDTRELSLPILEMMREFGLDPDRRTRLDHDCTVFALACEHGDPLTDLSFAARDRRLAFADLVINQASDGRFDHEPDLSIGQIALTTNSLPDSVDHIRFERPHFMVKATPYIDENPLYASKLGPCGPVALHAFSDLREFYPYQTAGHIKGLTMVPS